MGVMLELKTETRSKGCIMWSFIIYTACQMLGFGRMVALMVRNVTCMGVKVVLNGFLIMGRKVSIQKVKLKQSCYRPGVARGFQEVKVPRFHDIATGWW